MLDEPDAGASPPRNTTPFQRPRTVTPAIEQRSAHMSHLRALEAESIHILREAVSELENPVMLYSIGKDSSVMLRLAEKAFAPAPLPFPLMHIDTTWKLREMIAHLDRMSKEVGAKLIVHTNQEGVKQGINPFDHGSNKYTSIMKTDALKAALSLHAFDCTFGGARRDEERSRAKERVFSFRDRFHQWDPKNQRPELWSLYNARIGPGESVRVFPLSNWTELDVWLYVWTENIPVVPLYFAKARPVVRRGGTLIMVDDDRMRLEPGEKPMTKTVRFRTLGCYPLSGAIESTATTVPEIIREMLITKQSERQGRLIDHDEDASMENKKREGYFCSGSHNPLSGPRHAERRRRPWWSSPAQRSTPTSPASRRRSCSASSPWGRSTTAESTLIGRLLFTTPQLGLRGPARTSRRPRRRAAWRPPRSTSRSSPTASPPSASRGSLHRRRRVPLLRHRPAQVHHRRHAGARSVHAQHGDGRVDGHRRHHAPSTRSLGVAAA